MYFHKKHIHPLRKYILPAKKTKQFHPKEIYIQKNKEIFPKSYIPQKMISRNYIPNKSSIPETNNYIAPKKIYSHQKKI